MLESKKDPKKAKKWPLKAANANDPQSQYNLGELYYNGTSRNSFYNGTSRKSPYGDFTVSMKDAYKLNLLSADKDVPSSYASIRASVASFKTFGGIYLNSYS